MQVVTVKAVGKCHAGVVGVSHLQGFWKVLEWR